MSENSNMQDLPKKWAMITGASSGIGEATTFELAEKGYSLWLCARRKQKLDKLVNLLSEKFPQQEFLSVEMDVSDSSQITNFVKEHQEKLNHIQVLINNAGLAKGTDYIQNAKTSDWDEMINTNIKGLFFLTREILPFMIKNNFGDIINIGSVAGHWVYPGGAVYCATKFAVRAFSEGLRMDLIGKNIRVLNLEPGMVETEFSEVRFQDKDKAKNVYKGMRPLLAKDLAETISWCLLRPRHINVQELMIFPTDQAAVGQVFRQN